MASLFIGLVLVICVIGCIVLTLFITKRKEKKKAIIFVVGVVAILFIGLIIANKVLKINLGFDFNLGGKDYEAVCSNNDTTFIKLYGNSKKTSISEELHSNNSYFADTLCNTTNKIAYSYDKNASVSCDDKDIYSSYERKEDINIVIGSYKENDYKCFIYGSDLEEHKNIIVGSWCGIESNMRYKYTFSENGSLTQEYDWKDYDYKANNDEEYRNNKSGYYTFNGNSITTSLPLDSDTTIISEEKLMYDENTNTLKNGNFIYNKCD